MKFLAIISTLIVAGVASPAASTTDLAVRTSSDNQPVFVKFWTGEHFTGQSFHFDWEEGTVCQAMPSNIAHQVKSMCVCAPAYNSGVATYDHVTNGQGINIIKLSELGSGYSDRMHDGCYPSLFEFENKAGGFCVWTTA